MAQRMQTCLKSQRVLAEAVECDLDRGQGWSTRFLYILNIADVLTGLLSWELDRVAPQHDQPSDLEFIPGRAVGAGRTTSTLSDHPSAGSGRGWWCGVSKDNSRSTQCSVWSGTTHPANRRMHPHHRNGNF